jgi:rhodanese-related sulfurtransferase
MIRGAIPAHVSVIAKQGVSVDGPDVWVHCGGGYRAMVATGFLERLGYRVTTVVDSAPPDLTTLI